MKGRARLPSSPESDESWIVDCPCGVNFDDGEEMVDCDECGVWVHTSCCRVLKGHTSYVCDKCKLNKKKESEESEVAQLLIDLPSKTPLFAEGNEQYPLRTALSINERAHVHGIPGGEPEFFVGASPVFSRQLWISTGYVPKVLGFKYNDLPEYKDTTHALFADCNDDPQSMAQDQKPEAGRAIYRGVQQTGDEQMTQKLTGKERHSRRELRKGTKFCQRLQEDKVTYQTNNKRRRDEGAKTESVVKKRTRKAFDAFVDSSKRDNMALPLRSSRIASRNPKAVRKLSIGTCPDQRVSDIKNTNDHLLRTWGSKESDGSGSGLLMKASRVVADSALDYPTSPDFCKPSDLLHVKESGRVSQLKIAYKRGSASSNVGAFVQREYPNNDGNTESRNPSRDSLMGDFKAALQRPKINVTVPVRHQSQECVLDTTSDPMNRHEKASQSGDTSDEGIRHLYVGQSRLLSREGHLMQDLSLDISHRLDDECMQFNEDEAFVCVGEQGRDLNSPKTSSLSTPTGDVGLSQPLPRSRVSLNLLNSGNSLGTKLQNTDSKGSSTFVEYKVKTSRASPCTPDRLSSEQYTSISKHSSQDPKELVKMPINKGPLLDTHFLAPPELNDEEELNNSPRVGRIARAQIGGDSHHLSSRRSAAATMPNLSLSEKEHCSTFRRKTAVEGSHGSEDVKLDASGSTRRDGVTQNVTKDLTDSSDKLGLHDFSDKDRRGESILTLPGLIEEILHERGHQASYDYICDEVLPHWPNLRKHNGEPYAYTSHRQAVLDCLRNRSAWSHLVDRGPKVMRANLGRKKHRLDLTGAADQSPHVHEDERDDPRFERSPKNEIDGDDSWQILVDQGKDVDMSLPEEVPKGKRKARRGRRCYEMRSPTDDRTTGLATCVEEHGQQMISPVSEDATSTYSEEDEILVHHVSNRHRASSV